MNAFDKTQHVSRFIRMASACVLLLLMCPDTLVLSAPAPEAELPVLVEAEGFENTGGWVIDPQFMDIMGSPYLLAHGLGVPVNDASTETAINKAGSYRVWVRTKDWVAQWKAPGTPGQFQVIVNGSPLKTTFGIIGAQWHWQDGGTIELPKGKIKIALHDLTGFEGRCDAILFSSDTSFVPPNADPEMNSLRQRCLGFPDKPETAGSYDLVVSGGGIAGICAAVSAARLGLKVAFIQDRPVLGGNNSSEVRVWLQGARSKEPWPRVGDVISELEPSRIAHYGPENTADIYEDGKKLALVKAEPNIALFLGYRSNGVEMDGKRIRAVLAQDVRTGKRLRFAARWFADCTGDACIGALAGADFDIRKENKMGPCNLWNVSESKDADAVAFQRCPWALDLSDKPFPGRDKGKPDPKKLGGWYWESGADRDPIADMEYVRDWNFRAMYGAWDALKNVDKVLPAYRLNWSAYILGKRESRRLMGDVILDVGDLEADRKFPDGCAPTGWSNDLHVPDPKYNKGFEGEAFISKAEHGRYPAYAENRPFWIPYRCMYSRNIDNLFMAGRCISVTHEALGAVRVMRTGGTMGEIVGMAASVCKEFDTDPRGVYEKHLTALQDRMRKGVGKVDGSTVPYANQGDRMSKSKVPAKEGKDIEKMDPDLIVPPVTDGEPAPGQRVKQYNADYTGSNVYHVLYLPGDWVKGAKYPVIVEYAGNRSGSSLGTVEGSSLGYGISAGKGVIWICMPFVDRKKLVNAVEWWGDAEATVEYCKQTVRRICDDYGGDASNVFIAGFSRGSIACNYIGLYDDAIAALWRGFICHSHYDGVADWPGITPEKALERLKRLNGRPQFISHEESVEKTRMYLSKALPDGNFTFQSLPFSSHTDRWVLRDIPERQKVRNWFSGAITNH